MCIRDRSETPAPHPPRAPGRGRDIMAPFHGAMGPGHGALHAQWVAKAGSLWDPCNWPLCGEEFGEARGQQHELE
eukprot:7719059-Alexandrium_andersonii.AAC.1